MRNNRVTAKERLEHIVKAISDIEKYIIGHSKKSFLKDDILINAVLFQFAIIGEAIIHIDNSMLNKYKYPWYKVRGFRNFIIHEYHAIEFRIVWEATIKDLPELKKVVQSILANEF